MTPEVSFCLEALPAQRAAVSRREVPRLNVPHHVVVLHGLQAAVGAHEIAPLVLGDEVLHRRTGFG